MHYPWRPVSAVPDWVTAWEPLTTGFLGQPRAKLWVAGHAAIALRAQGIVYPVFPEAVPAETAAAARSLLQRLPGSWCAMGPSSWLERLEPLLPPSRITHEVSYDFMARPPMDSPTVEGTGLVRFTGLSDLSQLFPLHEAYEKEEVLFSPGDFQPLASRLHFAALLKSLPSAALYEGDQPLAKVASNAATDRWVQLGGVYTRVDCRRRGLQRRLLAWFLSELAREGRGACLFVKTKNAAAAQLYRGLGFQSVNDFKIRYGVRHFGVSGDRVNRE